MDRIEGQRIRRLWNGHLYRQLDVLLRVSLMHFLDLLLNGTLFSLLIQIGQLTTEAPPNRTLADAQMDFAEILFSPHRKRIDQLWEYVSLGPYVFLTFTYCLCVIVAALLLVAEISHLLTVLNWLGPLVLVYGNYIVTLTLVRSMGLTKVVNLTTTTSDDDLSSSKRRFFDAFLPGRQDQMDRHSHPSVPDLVDIGYAVWPQLYSFAVKVFAALLATYVTSRLYFSARMTQAAHLYLCIRKSPVSRLFSAQLSTSPRVVILSPLYLPASLFILSSLLAAFNLSLPTPNWSAVSAVTLVVYSPILALECFTFKDVLSQLILIIRFSYRHVRNTVNNFGLQVLLVQHWNRLDVSTLLRVFWVSRFSLHLMFLTFNNLFHQKFGPNGRLNVSSSLEPSTNSFDSSRDSSLQESVSSCLVYCVEYLLARSTETIVSLFGMTSMLSSAGQSIGAMFHLFLRDNDDEERNAGSLTGVLFLVLALQTGLTGLSVEKRLLKIYRNFWLVITAMLHFVHHMTNNVLMTISTSGQLKFTSHLRALLVSFLLFVSPIVFLYHLYHKDELFNPWLMSVTIFAVEVFLKMAVSFIIYCMFVVDSISGGCWENLDDGVFIVKAFGAVLEFLFGVLLFGNGIWILLFDNGGFIRATMICIHAYCNIWLLAKEGWANFQRRRNAVQKLSTLENASEAQLNDLGDVCSICYQDMMAASKTVKVTRCGHLFHSICLRKWLYINEKCPMCHQGVFG